MRKTLHRLWWIARAGWHYSTILPIGYPSGFAMAEWAYADYGATHTPYKAVIADLIRWGR